MRFLTAGESHGKALNIIIDSFPSNVIIDLDYINRELSKRQKGFGRGGRMRIESDQIEIISGMRNGKTTGSPISFLIRNKDWENWEEVLRFTKKEGTLSYEPIFNPRPGHADLNGYLKYRLSDIRDVIERSSARETASRTAVGCFAKLLLKNFDIKFHNYVFQIGSIIFEDDNFKDYGLLLDEKINDLRCPDSQTYEKMIDEIKKAQSIGDTLGGAFRVIAENVPIGLGSYTQWDHRLDGKLAQSMMSIPAIKAVEIGNGFKSAKTGGLDFHDAIYYDTERGFYRHTNHAGGIEGGISNGEPLVLSAYMKPIPTTMAGLRTVNIMTKKNDVSLKERSDVCAVPSASIVGESVVAIVIANAFLEKFGTDNIEEIKENFIHYKKYIQDM
jgi:chorismate synthase